MNNIKDNKYYLDKIVKDVEFIISSTKNVTLDDFNDDEMINSAVNFKFIQISENVSRLGDAFLNEHNDIPWFKIKGMRNKIVHDYENVFFDVIYNTIQNDLPILFKQLKELHSKL